MVLDSLVGIPFVNEPGNNELRILLTLDGEGTPGDEVVFCFEDMTRGVCDVYMNTSKSWVDSSCPLPTLFILL